MKTLDSWTGKTADTELLRRCKKAITDVATRRRFRLKCV